MTKAYRFVKEYWDQLLFIGFLLAWGVTLSADQKQTRKEIDEVKGAQKEVTEVKRDISDMKQFMGELNGMMKEHLRRHK